MSAVTGTLSTGGNVLIHGTVIDNQDEHFAFVADDARSVVYFPQDDWSFKPDPIPEPTYPVLSVATGGVYVPAVKTFEGWVYVNENGQTYPVNEHVILARVKEGTARIIHEGKDITEKGAQQ